MRRFYNFRSNLKSLEYYHKFKDLHIFKEKCHDYYMMFPLWLLENDYFDEVVTWRLSDKPLPDIIFNISPNKVFIQRWVKNFNEIFKYPKPTMSFFRGGFPEYDQITKAQPKHFGKKIYLAAGQRLNAQWGGKYDIFLMEDDLDLKNNPGTLPYYKTAVDNIFKPLNIEFKEYDICWPCNFTQLKYKRQEYFIKKISESKVLKQLRIAHCGNKPEVGKQLCRKYNVNNIEFLGLQHRESLNNILNKSRVGLNLSNRLDGCPRVSTEILMSGTPLVINEDTRLLKYYKQFGVIEVNDGNFDGNLIHSIKNYENYAQDVIKAVNSHFSFNEVNKKNIDLWL